MRLSDGSDLEQPMVVPGHGPIEVLGVGGPEPTLIAIPGAELLAFPGMGQAATCTLGGPLVARIMYSSAVRFANDSFATVM